MNALSHIGRRWREEGVLSPEDVIAALAALDVRVAKLERADANPERFALGDWGW